MSSSSSAAHAGSSIRTPSWTLEHEHVARQDTTVPNLATEGIIHADIALDVDRVQAHVIGRDGENGVQREATRHGQPASTANDRPSAGRTFDEPKHLRVRFVTPVDRDGDTVDDSEGSRERFVAQRERFPVADNPQRPHITHRLKIIFKRTLSIMLISTIAFAQFFPAFNLLAYLALIPLFKLLSFATDMLYVRLGKKKAGLFSLLSLTRSATMKLFLQIAILGQCQLKFAQLALIGSILINLLLIPGVCLIVGCIRSLKVGFGTNKSRLNLSVLSILFPAAFYNTFQPTKRIDHDILSISRGVAVILLFIFASFTLFKFMRYRKSFRQRAHHTSSLAHPPDDAIDPENSQQDVGSVEPQAGLYEMDEVTVEEPRMSGGTAITLFLVVSMVVIPPMVETSTQLVESLAGVVRSQTEFASFLFLPIVENSIDYERVVTTTKGSLEKKLIAAMDNMVDSITETVFLVTPITVLLGWALLKPMTLFFDSLHCIVLLFSVVAVNCVARNGKSNWLDGIILICLYAIITVLFWFYPGSDPADIFSSCQSDDSGYY